MTSRLSAFRADATPSRKKVWEAPAAEDFAHGLVLAVDQSLAALGWVWLAHDHYGLEVLARGSVRTKPEDFPKGHEGTLQRGMEVYDEFGLQVEGALDRLRSDVWGKTQVVHETPPVGTRMARPESSLVAAMVVRVVIQRSIGLSVSMVANQHAKAVLTGNANADKKVWHQALGRYPITGDLPTNEGERDALCLALTHLYDLRMEAS